MLSSLFLVGCISTKEVDELAEAYERYKEKQNEKIIINPNDGDDDLDIIIPDPEPIPEPEPEPEPEPTVIKKLNHHHYNPAAWKGSGSAVVLCPGAKKMDSCRIGNTKLVEHSRQDKGRYVYTDYKKKGLKGTLSCVRNGITYQTTVKANKLQYGQCTTPEPETLLIDTCEWFAVTNVNRPTWYCKKAMKKYPKNFILHVVGHKKIEVTNNGERWEGKEENAGWVIKQSYIGGRTSWTGVIAPNTSFKKVVVKFKKSKL